MRFLFLVLILRGATAWSYTLNGNDSYLVGWDASSIVVNEDFSQCPDSTQPYMAYYVARARAAWNALPGLTVTLQRGALVNAPPSDVMAKNDEGSPVVLCNKQFPKDTGADANTIPALTGILVDKNSHKIIYGYTMLNADPSSRVNVGQIDPNGVAVVIAHEFGHLLGLGHSADPSALMYFDVSGKTDPTPAPDDVIGVRHMYSTSSPRQTTQGGCGSVKPREDSQWFIQFLAMLLLAQCFVRNSKIRAIALSRIKSFSRKIS